MSGQSFGPFRIEILGGMDIDGDPRTGVFLSAEIPQLRGVGAMMGDDVVIASADVVQALVDALRDLMSLVDDAREDVDVHAMDPGGAWLCSDEMHCRMGAAMAALIAVEGDKP